MGVDLRRRSIIDVQELKTCSFKVGRIGLRWPESGTSVRLAELEDHKIRCKIRLPNSEISVRFGLRSDQGP